MDKTKIKAKAEELGIKPSEVAFEIAADAMRSAVKYKKNPHTTDPETPTLWRSYMAKCERYLDLCEDLMEEELNA